MSLSEIIAALGGIGAVIGGLVWVFKYTTWAVSKSPEEVSQDLAKSIQKKQTDFENTGIPQ